MERRDHRAAFEIEALSPNTADAHLPVQNDPGGEIAERDDHAGVDVLHGPVQERPAGFDLVRQRVAVPRRAAPNHVRDVYVLTAKTDLSQQSREELPGSSHEGLALLVLVIARTFADEHDLGMRIADT